MGKLKGKKSKVPKITEEEYARYINALKREGAEEKPTLLHGSFKAEEGKEKQV